MDQHLEFLVNFCNSLLNCYKRNFIVIYDLHFYYNNIYNYVKAKINSLKSGVSLNKVQEIIAKKCNYCTLTTCSFNKSINLCIKEKETIFTD